MTVRLVAHIFLDIDLKCRLGAILEMIQNLGEALQESCIKHANRMALSSIHGDFTYLNLLSAAKGLAEKLKTLGVGLNEPVHVLVSNQPTDIAAILAIWLSGGVIVPIHRSSPLEVHRKIQQKSHANHLVDFVTFDKAPKITRIGSSNKQFDQLLDDAAFVIFTSGSTGEPKGVVVSHQSFQGKLIEIDRLLKFNQSDRVLLVLNINFVFGLWTVLETLLHGGTLYLHEKFDPEIFVSTLTEKEITRVGVVPTMMRVIFSKSELVEQIRSKVNTGTLQQILIGGESLGRSLALMVRKEFSKSNLIDIYGSTETASCDFFSFPENFSEFPGCIGKPSGGVKYRIVNEFDIPVERGVEGSLQIDSPYLMKGYLGDPELTKAAFSGEWFKTGDIAKEVAPSVLELMGRSKDLISRGGNKVTPGEIEQAICAHPSVAAAMAVGIPDALLGERIHMLIVLNSMKSLNKEEIKDHLGLRLEKYKLPDVFYFGDALPTGKTGKADRTQLRDQILNGLLIPEFI
ncbi:class I adenylate-forming enzyme family protein [Polynucleobacter sp. AP-Melu-500A-A1]|uniref:class I adenylate-forming enzyme family protein n=1 Tax=Polynucleobacter sp. AP-Melu-500A-A1 TaxID=2576929 RepID=UPI001C0D2C16|nr:class I adenylate-forming enzyme family protein [Polynucleobacter sp. AP-Melu-500A-A1]MBU3631694.1 acyl--CoA ligase [Polynucleobacter sp. AP-Melu-500A-A1]